MKATVKAIIAYPDRIEIHVANVCPNSADGLFAKAFVPTLCGDGQPRFTGRCVADHTEIFVEGDMGYILFPRKCQVYDLLICRFEVYQKGEVLAGVKYVICQEGVARHVPLDIGPKPVGTWVTCPGEDMDAWGLGCMMTEINAAWIQTLTPKAQDIPHVWNGQTYYFDKEAMDMYDNLMQPCIQRKIPCLVRLINRFSYRLKGSDEALVQVIGHPAYQSIGFGEQMSGFNVRTEEGLHMYCACVDFLAARYADPKSPYFCSAVMDIGNEINAQAVWHNTGPMTCGDFMEEYTLSLRLAHLITRTHNASHRVDVSFDHHFAIPFRDDPMGNYESRECLAYLAAIAKRDGDFDWGISAHPYPENLSRPDFYHDQTAVFSYDSPRITMKNIEVWQAIANLPAIAYQGQPRKVVFDEQGFHTDYSDSESEAKGAYGFVLLYQKMKQCPEVEMFLINRYADMPEGDEGELHLGLRYERGYADEQHLFILPGAYKQICHAITAMEGPEEAEWIERARDYIGQELFDELLTPPAILPTTYFDDIARRVGIDLS